ncbi:MAG: GTP 3',8-cyclase MoaA [Desulfovermiculus sp.]|nr:GTP 3',8-cyclase MoaA [Desulfovermiculus sp.]
MDTQSSSPLPESLVDQHGRSINYLRLSLTDRCNLRCFYCNTCTDYTFIPHEQILTYEECLQLIGLASRLGLSKVRLTGGEPLVRRNCVHFVERILGQYPQLDLRMTTNGTLLAPEAKRLSHAGLQRVNISLDTLDRAKFERITGRDLLFKVRRGIDACLEEGLKVKLNVVALKGVNDQELSDFIRLALDYPLDIRFIEFMPVGHCTAWSSSYFWPAEDILQAARSITPVEPHRLRTEHSGPARMYTLPEGQGRLGLISPMSDHFCNRCNRFRITPDGRLRTCLFSDREYTLRPLLRSSKLGPEAALRVLRAAGRKKPIGSKILEEYVGSQGLCQRDMNAIGG